MKPNYDCIIRTYNSEKTISQVLNYINNQTLIPNNIIFVDNGSSDRTKQIIKAQRNGIIINYPYKIFNYSKSINLALKHIKSKYVLIISSHTIIKNSTILKKALEILEENQNYIGITLNRMIHDRNKSKLSFTNASNFNGFNGIWNTSGIYRKNLLDLRSFREDLPTCEDSEWSIFFLRKYSSIFPNIKEALIPHLYDAEAINLNQRTNIKKRINEHISIAYFSNKKLLSLNSIFSHIKEFIIQVMKLRFFTKKDKDNLAFNFFVIPRLIKARFKKPIFESRYF